MGFNTYVFCWSCIGLGVCAFIAAVILIVVSIVVGFAFDGNVGRWLFVAALALLLIAIFAGILAVNI